MPINNNWLTPYQRSFNSIKAKLLNSMRNRVPEVTDYSEGNIFVILVSMFAAIAEVLHYYIDNMARETFFPTARRYTSLYKHAQLVDYHIKCAVPATTDVVLYVEEAFTTDQVISINTQFNAVDGSVWVVERTVLWEAGVYSIKVPLIQKERSAEAISLGNITTVNNPQIYVTGIESGKYYVEGSMKLNIGDDIWTLVETFAYSNSTDKTYKVEPDQAGDVRIVFGDGIHGMKPNLNSQVTGDYWVTLGSDGNIDENSFKEVPTDIKNWGVGVQISHPNAASGGSSYETFSMIRDHVPLSVKTLGVTITKEDYEAVCKMVPGVNKAYCYYECSQNLQLVISPDGGIEASSALINEVKDAIDKAKVITTQADIISTRKTLIYLDADVYGKKSFSKNDISAAVIDALLNAYNSSTSEINQTIWLSDIYSLIDNLDTVDHVELNRIYLVSAPIPESYNETSADQVPNLKFLSFNQIAYYAHESSQVYVNIVSTTQYEISLGTYTGTGFFGTALHVDCEIAEFEVNVDDSITYNPGTRYSFTLQPMNISLTPSNYNIPVFEANTIILNVYESV